MSEHKSELIDTAVVIINKAISMFSKNSNVEPMMRNMFKVSKLPDDSSRGDGITSISLDIKLPRSERPKRFALNVACDNNIMLLLKINYYVIHALALISMATRGEPVDAFVDQFNDYNAEKESDEVSGRYCGNRKSVRQSGGGSKKKTVAVPKKATAVAPKGSRPSKKKLAL